MLKIAVCGLGTVGKSFVDHFIKYQDLTIVNPNRKYPINENFSFNFKEVINFSAKLKNLDNSIIIEAKNYENNLFEWGKETLWWGRRVAANKAKINKAENIDISKMEKFNPNIFDKR